MTNQVLFFVSIIVICLIIMIVEFCLGIRYKKSSIYKGEVQDSIKTEIVRIGGGRGAGEIYETYDVLYEYNGKLLRGEVCTREKGLKHGDKIDVHVYEEGDFHEIQSDIYWRKFKLTAVGCCVAVVAVIFLWLYILSSEYTRSSQQHSYTHSANYNVDTSIDNYVDIQYYNTDK